MNIKGIYKTSLIDYPGKICSIFFSGGCNMKCRYCHNPELVCNRDSLPTMKNEEALDFVKKRRGLIDGVSISGGEPTLSKNLALFTGALHEMGLSVKIDTNGLNPGAIDELLDNGLLDYVAVDIKTSPGKYGELTGRPDAFPLIQKTLDVLRQHGADYEIRTTCIPGYISLEDLGEIREAVGFVDRYYLQQFVNGVTLDESFRRFKPYSLSELERFRDYVRQFAEVCEIRGV